MTNESYWSWFHDQAADGESERAAFPGESSVALLEEPQIELEPPIPTGFESFWS